MNVNNLKETYVPDLLSMHQFNEIIYFIHNKRKIENKKEELTKKEYKLFLKIIKKFKKQNQMLEHILKNKYFYEYDFYVNKNTLIPRGETELIVDEILNYDLNNKNLFDICCGSGCIGITIKKINNNVNLFLSDISKKALKVTKKNLEKHSVDAKLFCVDFLKVFELTNTIPDFITINPPYIDENSCDVASDVKKFEPSLALFTKEKGYKFYNILFNNLDKLFLINENLVIVSEIGFDQKEELEKKFSPWGVKYNIEFKKDYSGNWRLFVINLKGKHGKIKK